MYHARINNRLYVLFAYPAYMYIYDVYIHVCHRVEAVGQSFFTPNYDRTTTLGDGREVWFGYHQSLRPSMWKTLLLNIDS